MWTIHWVTKSRRVQITEKKTSITDLMWLYNTRGQQSKSIVLSQPSIPWLSQTLPHPPHPLHSDSYAFIIQPFPAFLISFTISDHFSILYWVGFLQDKKSFKTLCHFFLIFILNIARYKVHKIFEKDF